MFSFLSKTRFAIQTSHLSVGLIYLIPIGTNCAPLIDLFLYSYAANFMQGLLKKNKKKLTKSFNFTFLCLSPNQRITSLVTVDCMYMYLIKLEINDITDTPRLFIHWHVFFFTLIDHNSSADKPDHAVTLIKQSLVLNGHFFVLSYNISYELNLF